MKLRVDGLGKHYTAGGGDPGWVLRDVGFELAAGECLTIVGPSGCGKTTVLVAAAGLVPYEAGTIEVDGRTVRAPGPDRAVVFQQASLLPWRTALGNAAYGMEMQRRVPRGEIRRRAEAALRLAGLDGYEHYYPSQLSGGMQQRVNLARAIATEPDLLLMDEPFGALDAMTRERMQEELVGIMARTKLSVLFITHDVTEALYLGDRVAVMGGVPGRIRQVVDVPFDRPRALTIQEDPAFVALRRHIREVLEAPADIAERAGSR